MLAAGIVADLWGLRMLGTILREVDTCFAGYAAEMLGQKVVERQGAVPVAQGFAHRGFAVVSNMQTRQNLVGPLVVLDSDMACLAKPVAGMIGTAAQIWTGHPSMLAFDAAGNMLVVVHPCFVAVDQKDSKTQNSSTWTFAGKDWKVVGVYYT